MNKVRFILSEGLGDGQHWTVVDDVDLVLDAVKQWLEDNKDDPGQSFEIKTRIMSDEAVEKLPTI